MRMTGNSILVTGGGTGIGRGLAVALHQLGNRVVISGRRDGPLQQVAETTPGIGYLTQDQGDPADAERFATALIEAYPGLNVVINNAGIQRPEHLLDGEFATAAETIATNLLGVIRLTAKLLPVLRQKPSATIINVTSALAFMPSALVPTYCATKAALHSYTQSLRFQLQGTAIEVIEIIPPKVQTALQGDHGFDPNAMPLDEFLSETMKLMQTHPQASEIVVERAEGLRFAERRGVYDELYPQFNDAATATRYTAPE